MELVWDHCFNEVLGVDPSAGGCSIMLTGPSASDCPHRLLCGWCSRNWHALEAMSAVLTHRKVTSVLPCLRALYLCRAALESKGQPPAHV